jgi:FtsZ-binding cell division protein ZapB
MKKYLLFAVLASITMTSCVTLGKYEDLESRYNQTVKDRNLAKRELKELKDENAELQRQNQTLTVNAQDMGACAPRLRHHNGKLHAATLRQKPRPDEGTETPL